MTISVLAVAGKPASWVQEASDIYVKRLPRAWRLSVSLLAPSKKSGDAEGRKADEWRRVAARLDASATLILLDERGRGLGSRAFADNIRTRRDDGESLVFLIGGPDGVHDDCRQRAAQTLSLAPFTMPHEMARVVLLEQIYRAHTIIERHPYHRD
ncbi:MAG: 23S rRNA (pseudouridine(1915)-N(3))-methyltransferase RlmH [Pseudomonadota bacterium]